MKVLLITMPYGALGRPALGLSLLKSALARSGIPCDIRYLNFRFAEHTGKRDYDWVATGLPFPLLAAEWTFTRALYGEDIGAEGAYLREVLQEDWDFSDRAIDRILRVRSRTDGFLAECMSEIPWEQYSVVGFTSTFEQTIPSLALARRIRAARPDIRIVFGGANWEADMGLELHRRFPFVDFVCSGESERSFPALLDRIRTGAGVDASIRGIVYRDGNESIYTGTAEPIRNLDELPVPDFTDYFESLWKSRFAASVEPIIPFETSRGCWWGEISHCTFCGLNGGTMTYRSKSAARALEELAGVVDRWKVKQIEMVDNIIDLGYFRDFLPELAARKMGLHIFYEVKANLNRDQIRILREAGVHDLQAGIESLSTRVLKLMRKGTTALQNVQIMKWCKEFNIFLDWNLLHGFPGEEGGDYRDMLELLGSIRHLQPPMAVGEVALERFSPYFDSPGDFGLKDVRPARPYRYLFPFEEDSLRRIAYFFDYETEEATVEDTAAIERFVRNWRKNPEKGLLVSIPRDDGTLILVDSRSDAAKPGFSFSGHEKAAFEFCDRNRSVLDVARHLRREFPGDEFGESRVRGILDAFVADRIMVTDRGKYLNLAIGVH